MGKVSILRSLSNSKYFIYYAIILNDIFKSI
jgi:hypothetical protein